VIRKHAQYHGAEKTGSQQPKLFDCLPESPAACGGDLYSMLARLLLQDTQLPLVAVHQRHPLVPATHSPGHPQYWLGAPCQTDPSCVGLGWIDVSIMPESWPTLTPNSLRVTKADLQHTLTWGYETGGGKANVHRSLVAADLSALPPACPPSSPPPRAPRTSRPSPSRRGGVASYRVYPRMSGSGDSAPLL